MISHLLISKITGVRSDNIRHMIDRLKEQKVLKKSQCKGHELTGGSLYIVLFRCKASLAGQWIDRYGRILSEREIKEKYTDAS